MLEATVRSVVVAGQSPLWVRALTEVVAGLELTAVVGTARTAREALELVGETRCDVLVCDVSPGQDEMTGLELTAVAVHLLPSLRAVVVGGDDEPTIRAALDAGASAYVVKSAEPAALRAAIRHALNGSLGALRPPAIGRSRPTPTVGAPTAPAASPQPLTGREQDVLRCAAEGLSNAELARRLWITEQTVKFHLSNIYRKLGVTNRADASRWAALNGYAGVGSDGAHGGV